MPAATGTDLDDVRREVVRSLVQLREFAGPTDAAPIRRKTRTKDVCHETQLRCFADRTVDPRRVTQLACRTKQLGMGIAHLMLSQPAPMKLVDQVTPRQPVIDDASAHRLNPEPGRHGATGYRVSTLMGAAVRSIEGHRREIRTSSAGSDDTGLVDTPTVTYGIDLPDDREFRLCGDVVGKRVLELGSPGGNAVSLARLGARASLVEPSSSRISELRRLAETHEVTVECHLGGHAELGFATSASIDLVICTDGLRGVDDVSRVFRQVHRVLKPGSVFVFAAPHPFTRLVGADGTLQGSYGNPSEPLQSVAGLFAALGRASFVVDVLLEPMGRGPLPTMLIVRARKLGI